MGVGTVVALVICFFLGGTASQGTSLEVKVIPQSINKKELESTTFLCKIEGPQWNSSWTRKRSGEKVGEGPLLRLDNLRQSDSGEYCCVVDILSARLTVQACAALIVGGHSNATPAKPTVLLPHQMTVSSYTDVRILCNVTGLPHPSVKWERIHNNQSYHLSSNPVLHLENVAANHSGKYQCTASNDGGTASAVTVLVVQECPERNRAVGRIIGGHPYHKARWQVMIWKKALCGRPGSLMCGGVLIKKRFVLTAASCIVSRRFPTKFELMRNVVVKVGKTKVFVPEDFEQTRNIDRVRIHPKYNPTNLDNDIAILRLQRGVNLSHRQHIDLVSLPKKELYTCFERPGTSLLVTGYGLTSSFPSIVNDQLRGVRMPVAHISKCKQAFPTLAITKSMLCSGDGLGRVDSCMGDSGGPAAAFNPTTGKWQLVGITSWGDARYCARRGSYAVLTRVSMFIDWIQQSVHHDRDQPQEICENSFTHCYLSQGAPVQGHN